MIWMLTLLACGGEETCEVAWPAYCRPGAFCLECQQDTDVWFECVDDEGWLTIGSYEAALLFCWAPGTEPPF